MSLGHSVTLMTIVTEWPSDRVTEWLSDRVTEWLNHYCHKCDRVGNQVTWSRGHSVTWSLGHAVTRSLGHSVTWSLGHSVTWSLGHSVTRSLGHAYYSSDRMTEWPSDRVTEWPSDRDINGHIAFMSRWAKYQLDRRRLRQARKVIPDVTCSLPLGYCQNLGELVPVQWGIISSSLFCSRRIQYYRWHGGMSVMWGVWGDVTCEETLSNWVPSRKPGRLLTG